MVLVLVFSAHKSVETPLDSSDEEDPYGKRIGSSQSIFGKMRRVEKRLNRMGPTCWNCGEKGYKSYECY